MFLLKIKTNRHQIHTAIAHSFFSVRCLAAVPPYFEPQYLALQCFILRHLSPKAVSYLSAASYNFGTLVILAKPATLIVPFQSLCATVQHHFSRFWKCDGRHPHPYSHPPDLIGLRLFHPLELEGMCLCLMLKTCQKIRCSALTTV